MCHPHDQHDADRGTGWARQVTLPDVAHVVPPTTVVKTVVERWSSPPATRIGTCRIATVRSMGDDRWTERDGALRRTFDFDDFSTAFAFMTRVAMLAECAGHHPEWTNVYGRVSITLTTHDAGNTVTDMDRDLAEAIDRLVG